jgi:hypothetical protein
MNVSGINMITRYSTNSGGSFSTNNVGSIFLGSTARLFGNVLFIGQNGAVSKMDGFGGGPTAPVALITIPNTTGESGIAFAPDFGSWVHVGTGGFTRSTNLSGGPLTTKVTPEVCRGVAHCGSIIFIRSERNVYSTIDLGTTWVLFYSGSPRSIASSTNGSFLYILNLNGEFVSRSLTKPKRFDIGSTMKAFTPSVPFLMTSTTITGVTLLDIPPGLWSLSFGWGFSASSSVGDGTNNDVTYGLSYTNTGYEIFQENKSYAIIYNNITTYESYARCVTVNLIIGKSVFLNAKINNPSNSTGAEMSNCYIIATLLN